MEDENLQPETAAEGAPVLPEATTDAVESPTTEAAETPPADDASKPAKKDGAAQRIDELTRYRREAERERDYWRQMALQSKPAEKPEEPAKPTEPAVLPTLEQFQYDEAKYQAALRDYVAAEARTQALTVLEAERKAERERQLEQTWKSRTESFAKDNPDFAEKVNDPTLPITAQMAQAIRSSEIGPDVAYYLADHREEAALIAGLPAEDAALAIGRIEGRLLAKREVPKASPPPKVTQAPPPPPKLEAVEPETRVRTTDSSGDALSDDEWVKAERARLLRKMKRSNG